MLSNHMLSVHLGKLQSKLRRLNNDLPQGSILAPTLFNLYKCDFSTTIYYKFLYADDITLTNQYNKFEVTEEILSKDL